MLDTLFTFAALIGGTVLLFQFALMLLGLSDHGGDIAGADGGHLAGGGHFGGDGHFGSDLGGDVSGDLGGDIAGGHAGWHDVTNADLAHASAPWFYEMLSLRTLTAAATFFGLAGKTTLAYGYSPIGSLALATLAGFAAMWIVYWLFKQVYKLQHSGTENIRNAIGRPATVYVPIPGNRAGAGKVTFRMQNRLVEYLAVTEDDSRLATGEKVVVVAIVNSDTVRVARATATVPDMVSSA